MDPENIIDLAVPLLFILGFFAAIGVGVYLVMNLRRGEGLQVSLRALFQVYLYLLSIITLLLLVGGVGHLVRAGLASTLGNDFSYNAPFAEPLFRYAPGEEPPAKLTDEEEAERLQDAQERREQGLQREFEEGLLRGISFTVFGGILWGAHIWGRRRIETAEEQRGFLNRIYLFLLLVIFGIITITSLPSAAFEALRFYILDNDDLFKGSPPGGALATALVSLPIWLLYLRGMIRSIATAHLSPPGEEGASE